MITDSSIQTVKTHIDIVDVISNYLTLQKRGSNYRANCPFHDEKTPSFVVSPQKQIYHCFGCSAGGDAISFVMDYEKLSYIEVIEKLAGDYNITLEYTKMQAPTLDLSILEKSLVYYKKVLHRSPKILEYLKQRGVHEATIEKFDLGCVEDGKEFIAFLQQEGINFGQAMKLGVVAKDSKEGYYAIFRDRILFPIFSVKNQIVGFGGRTTINHQAKYLNSPQTPLFNKSRLLYGYAMAREHIIKAAQIVITEGYMDVIMLHQAGFNNVVATLGTALTNDHIPLIKKIASTVLVAYDGDSAGRQAAFKAASLLQTKQINAKVVLFEGGVDPADLVAKNEISGLQKLFDKAQAGIEYILEYMASSYDLTNPLKKQEAYQQLMGFFSRLDGVLQYEYRSFLAATLQLDEAVIPIGSAKNSAKTTTTNKNKPPHKSLIKEDIGELTIIKTLIEKPTLLDDVLGCIEPSMFQYHQKEFEMIRVDTNCTEGLKIVLREDIHALSDENLLSQLKVLLRRYYQRLSKKASMLHLPFDEKAYLMRKIKESITVIDSGQMPVLEESLLPYFSTT